MATNQRVEKIRDVEVKGLPDSGDTVALETLFGRFGKVVSFVRKTNLAYITYDQPEEASRAVQILDGANYMGTILQARLRPPIPTGPAALQQASLSSAVSRMPARARAEMQMHLKDADSRQSKDEPTNLYILNIPLDMTPEELEEIFSAAGEVRHVCILAVMDQYGRRRAFVDMANSASAVLAVAEFSGRNFRGYRLEVSFALVQRSEGPAALPSSNTRSSHNTTFRPRAMTHPQPRSERPNFDFSAYQQTMGEMNYIPDNHLYLTQPTDHTLPYMQYAMPHTVPMAPALPVDPYSAPVSSSASAQSFFPASSLPSAFPVDEHARSRTLFIANLYPVAYIDTDDLQTLFSLYGTITDVELITDENGFSRGQGRITFEKREDAKFAQKELNGKVLAGQKVKVELWSEYREKMFREEETYYNHLTQIQIAYEESVRRRHSSDGQHRPAQAATLLQFSLEKPPSETQPSGLPDQPVARLVDHPWYALRSSTPVPGSNDKSFSSGSNSKETPPSSFGDSFELSLGSVPRGMERPTASPTVTSSNTIGERNEQQEAEKRRLKSIFDGASPPALGKDAGRPWNRKITSKDRDEGADGRLQNPLESRTTETGVIGNGRNRALGHSYSFNGPIGSSRSLEQVS